MRPRSPECRRRRREPGSIRSRARQDLDPPLSPDPRKKPLTPRSVEKMREREASVGVDKDDEAARWLDEHDPPPPPPKTPKSVKKSVTLHRFRQRHQEQRKDRA